MLFAPSRLSMNETFLAPRLTEGTPAGSLIGPIMKCPICGSNEVSKPIVVPDYEYGLPVSVSYGECSQCHSISQQPMPSEAQLKTFYPKNYHSFSAKGFLTKMRHELRLRSFQSALLPGSTLLDFGCGSGQFIQWAAERMPGVRFFGFEFDVTDSTEKRNGVFFIRGSLDFLLGQIPAINVLLMNHVIEHLSDPIDTLRKLRSKLSTGGQFVGQTPRAGSLEHRVFGTAWSGFHSPRHTVIFSSEGIEIALKNAGYSGVQVIPAFNPAGIAVSLASSLFPSKERKVTRSGVLWIVYLLGACLLSPFDRILGPSGIIDFKARVK
jgi:SAM-dependent methyltransferase